MMLKCVLMVEEAVRIILGAQTPTKGGGALGDRGCVCVCVCVRPGVRQRPKGKKTIQADSCFGRLWVPGRASHGRDLTRTVFGASQRHWPTGIACCETAEAREL